MAITASNTTNSFQFLNWEDRLPETKESCSQVFGKVREKGVKKNGESESNWGAHNGKRIYKICGIPESLLFKIRIMTLLKQNPNMRVFNYVGLGAGNFQEVDAMADYINSQTDLPDDIEVHIYGIRGEDFLGPTVEKVKRCVKHKIGGFPIEEMSKGFKKDLGIDLDGQVDVCISEWTLTHLVDPAGTWVQACNLIRPGGFLLFDGFYFLYQNQSIRELPKDSNMTRLLADSGWSFIIVSPQFRTTHYLLQRTSDQPCQIPMTYLSTLTLSYVEKNYFDVYSEQITRFKRLKEEEAFANPFPTDDCCIGNDKALHEFIKQNHLFYNESMMWKSIYGTKCSLPLHEAIKAQNPKAAEWLQKGVDINESDEEGDTPLHLTIDFDTDDCDTFPLFLKLIELKANVNLSNRLGEKPLHRAARFDTRGGRVGQLIDAGADPTCQKADKWTPMDLAIQHRNVRGLAALLRRKVKLSPENRQALKDPVFSWLFKQGLVPEVAENEKTAQET